MDWTDADLLDDCGSSLKAGDCGGHNYQLYLSLERSSLAPGGFSVRLQTIQYL